VHQRGALLSSQLAEPHNRIGNQGVVKYGNGTGNERGPALNYDDTTRDLSTKHGGRFAAYLRSCVDPPKKKRKRKRKKPQKPHKKHEHNANGTETKQEPTPIVGNVDELALVLSELDKMIREPLAPDRIRVSEPLL
jgi:hypothetical protein